MSSEERKPLCDGFATWYVWKAEDYVAKNGNKSIKLALLVKDEHGGSGFISEFLSEKTPAWKIKPFLATCGLESVFKNGLPDPDVFSKKEGTCRIKNRPGTPWFEVAEYIKAAPAAAKEEQAPIPEHFLEDEDDDIDIPF